MAKASLDSIAITDHGHALTIDNGWREVAETALNFVSRLEPAKGAS